MWGQGAANLPPRFSSWGDGVLKGQVTLFKLCQCVVCMALIIPRITLFLNKIRFHAKKMYLYACASVVFLCWRRKKNRIHCNVFGKFTIYIPENMPFFQISHVYQGIDIHLFLVLGIGLPPNTFFNALPNPQSWS